MLSLMIIRMAIGVSLCTGGCRDEELMAPPFHQQASSLVTSDSLCARVTFAVSGTSTVSTTFPSTSSCTTNLVLIKGTNAKWSSSTRKLSLFVKLTNKSGGSLQLPVRLYLPSTGTTVLTPAGTPASTVVAQNPDSSEVAGGRIWFIGGTGTLANNGSTGQDTVAFTVQAPTSQARLSFVATANSAGGGGGLPPLPTSVNWPQTNLALAPLPSNPTAKMRRNVFGLEFAPSMTAASYNSLLVRYGGVLIGGIGSGTPYHYYVIQFPDPGTTYAALDSLAKRLGAEPGVLNVTSFEYNYTLKLKSRYPLDNGLVSSRADWLGAGTQRTAPFLAIRAPMAWGCENGTYGGTLPKIGVADSYFDVQPSDLTTTQVFVPGSPTGVDTGFAHTADHGVAVASIIAAEGDNGTQFAGMMWRSDLDLYAQGTHGQIIDDMEFLASVVQYAVQRGVKVLNFSSGLGQSGDSGTRTLAKKFLAYYLDSGADRLVVIAAGQAATGQTGLRLTLTQVASSTDSRVSAVDRAAAELLSASGYKMKILYVAGATTTGMLDATSNLWTDADSAIIAAPSDLVYGLNSAGWSVPHFGTSFAAPFVTGTAAQLWTMDPTLSAAEVVRYLHRGARWQLDPINPYTGDSVAKAQIGSLPGGAKLYMLDAYGALVRLSYERTGTPLCGSLVYPEADSSHIQLVIPRMYLDTLVISSGGYQPPQDLNVSIAQGGRLIAVSNLNVGNGPEAWEYRKGTNGAWSRTRVISGVQRRTFLERDTAELSIAGTRTLLGKTYPTATTFNFAAWLSGITGGVQWVQYAPDGLHAIVAAKLGSAPCTGNVTFVQAWMVTLSSGSAQPLISWCSPYYQNATDAAWEPSSQRFILSEGLYTYTSPSSPYVATAIYQAFRLVSGSAALDGAEMRVTGRWPGASGGTGEGHTTDATGATAIFEEDFYSTPPLPGPPEGCYLVTRNATAPFAVRFYWGASYPDPFFLTKCKTPVQTTGRPRAPMQIR